MAKVTEHQVTTYTLDLSYGEALALYWSIDPEAIKHQPYSKEGIPLGTLEELALDVESALAQKLGKL